MRGELPRSGEEVELSRDIEECNNKALQLTTRQHASQVISFGSA